MVGPVENRRVAMHQTERTNFGEFSAEVMRPFRNIHMLALLPDPNSILTVIGTHMVHSRPRPVVRLDMSGLGLTLFARDNGSNIAVTVVSQRDINGIGSILSKQGRKTLDAVYFEGFERSGAPIHKSYEKSHRAFSFFYDNGGQEGWEALFRQICFSLYGNSK